MANQKKREEELFPPPLSFSCLSSPWPFFFFLYFMAMASQASVRASQQPPPPSTLSLTFPTSLSLLHAFFPSLPLLFLSLDKTRGHFVISNLWPFNGDTCQLTLLRQWRQDRTQLDNGSKATGAVRGWHVNQPRQDDVDLPSPATTIAVYGC